MKRYAPLAIGLIDEGRFVEQANADLLEMQRKLMAFVKEHGELAEGAKAKMTVEVTLSVASVGDETFGIKAQTKVALPARPASVTMAIADETEAGQPSLFVRRTGSDVDTPRQGKLCTDDGRLAPDFAGDA